MVKRIVVATVNGFGAAAKRRRLAAGVDAVAGAGSTSAVVGSMSGRSYTPWPWVTARIRRVGLTAERSITIAVGRPSWNSCQLCPASFEA
jgi:hypothetical protein